MNFSINNLSVFHVLLIVSDSTCVGLLMTVNLKQNHSWESDGRDSN